MKKFKSGASSSELKPRYDLIPVEAMRLNAERFALGAGIHGDHNYKKGGDDFWQDRINHLVEHLFKYIDGDKTDNHLGAILCNASMLAWRDKSK